MSFNDPIAETLTKIRNAAKAQHRFVDMSLSKSRLQVIEILHKKGFIEHFLVDRSRRRIRIFLKYRRRSSVIRGLKRVSKPGRRRFVDVANIPYVLNGIGIAILSTSKGVLEGEDARAQRVGGEVWCYVW
ncbi:MAG: 30S ribosomal protein S8 [Chlamydiota bacterium]